MSWLAQDVVAEIYKLKKTKNKSYIVNTRVVNMCVSENQVKRNTEYEIEQPKELFVLKTECTFLIHVP